MEQLFPTEQVFQEACAAFLAKYGVNAGFAPRLPRERAYVGWEWAEHRTKVSWRTSSKLTCRWVHIPWSIPRLSVCYGGLTGTPRTGGASGVRREG